MEDFDIVNFIFEISVYMGIVGFLMFIFSFLTGLRYIKPNPKYRLHKRIGIIGFVIVCTHASVMLYFHFLT